MQMQDANASQIEDSAFPKVITSLVREPGLCRLLTNQDSATTPRQSVLLV